MSNGIYTATGQVIDRDTNEGVPKLSVEAWDTNTQRAQAALGSANTDDNGRFSITLDLKKLQYEQAPDLFFKVFLNEKLLDSTESSVLWNANTQESVTIRIRTTRERPAGKDRLNTAQVFKGVDFFQKSDFKGVFNEYKGKASTSLGFIADIFKNAIPNMDLNPLQVTGVKHNDVINQDVNAARLNLATKNVAVQEVVPYQPGLNSTSLQNITSMPLNLKAGQAVRLYEENGKVKYYSIVKEGTAAGGAATASTTPAGTVPVATTGAGGAVSAAQLNNLQAALDSARQDAAKKDETINTLRSQVEALQKQQQEVDTLLKSEKFTKLMERPNG
ncbi:MAG: hypothetical protein J0H74_30105 [Chitinophagaceae bacterium]|nr:hypothetical protein [Chitinophagaceae bacterium]